MQFNFTKPIKYKFHKQLVLVYNSELLKKHGVYRLIWLDSKFMDCKHLICSFMHNKTVQRSFYNLASLGEFINKLKLQLFYKQLILNYKTLYEAAVLQV